MEPVILCKYDELVNPKTLRPHPKNPNVHPEDQLEALTQYIQFTGWRHAVIVSRLSGLVVAGHGRIEAARRLECSVPVVYQSFDDEAEELAFVLADNQLAELSHLDADLLETDLSELEGLDFDTAMLGFDVGEMIGEEQKETGSYSERWKARENKRPGADAPKRVEFRFGRLQSTYSEPAYDAFVAAVDTFVSLDAFVEAVIKKWYKGNKKGLVVK